jgi:hypothetical protein
VAIVASLVECRVSKLTTLDVSMMALLGLAEIQRSNSNNRGSEYSIEAIYQSFGANPSFLAVYASFLLELLFGFRQGPSLPAKIIVTSAIIGPQIASI